MTVGLWFARKTKFLRDTGAHCASYVRENELMYVFAVVHECIIVIYFFLFSSVIRTFTWGGGCFFSIPSPSQNYWRFFLQLFFK